MRALLLGQQFRGNDDAEVVRRVVRLVQDAANDLRGREAVERRIEFQIDAVDLIFDFAHGVLEAEEHGIERNIDEVIDVLGR